ncbi:hypothetical protein FQ377_03325 [Arthrobacter echini]|uniref:Uncharacterized protein n=1 Tax=Arthrobacter echini TaxID=1529066 RepID=A0A5D0XUT1_9MICC|nr:hypothetical protein [Arthrobacter echini]TYD00484.1 hypothetical protein FQ377_03325 [Arthrobacter echini]
MRLSHPRISHRPSALITAVMCASLLLAGCGSSTEQDTADTAEESPLGEYFAAAYGGDASPEEQQKQYAEDEREREDLVAQCMKDEGFEYTPNLQDASFMMSDDTEWDPESREWVAQYGYGMINYPGREEMESGNQDEYVDNNADYVESLSGSEQEAFYEALHGPVPDEEDMPVEGESMEYDWEAAGCYGWAEHERSGEDPMMSDEHKALMDDMNTLWESTMDAPELAELDAAWASCMADAGRPGFATQADAQNSINEEMNELYGEGTGDGPDEAKMAEAGEKEIELALADLDCREKTDYRAAALQVNNEQEQQFVDDHKAQLEAFKADLEQGR